MAKNSDVLRLLGYNYQTAVVLLGLFDHEGVDTKKAMSGLRTGAAQLAASGVKDIAGGLQGIVDAVKNAALETRGHRHCREVFQQRRCFKPFSRRKTAFLVCKKCVLKLFQ